MARTAMRPKIASHQDPVPASSGPHTVSAVELQFQRTAFPEHLLQGLQASGALGSE